MKSHVFALCFFGAATALAADPSAPATSAAPTNPGSSETVSAKSPALWVAVHLPKDTKPAWVGDSLAERFADGVSLALQAQGFKGKIGTLRPEETTSKQAAVLEVSLSEWTARAGAADCTFRASLQTPQGDRDLGIFSGGAMVVTPDGQHLVSSSGLQDAARDALAGLFGRMQDSKLLAPD